MQKVTIYDVARAAGVAPSTVSRALSNPGRVSDATRRRVQEAAEAAGYEVRPGSRAVRPAPRQTIAMVLADITNPHFIKIIRGAELRAKSSGFTLVVVNAEESAQIELTQIRGLASKVDGFVLTSSRLPDQELIAIGQQHKVVTLNRDVPGMTGVRLDMAHGCRQILEHLASLGHREFTFCAGPPGSWVGALRWATLRDGAKEYGLTAHRIGPYAPTVAAGGVAADAALRSRPTALVAHNDMLAFGIMQRLASRGVAVPEEVSVIGFDNNFAAELVATPLTTLDGPGAEVGARGVDLLLRSIAEEPERRGALTDPPNDRITLPTELILRASSGLAPVR
ncbi:LacI family DNA-binding transcriptional regulator [Zhihengliuella halotolerans]|uniref:LacI family DNA-binding transcriptional regulator n=1 Tax=Zhihengliuella halotolerans TaxID=370736 RepID=UPI000C80F3F5|nr:LacI family DNA-binding transcriptional regulator [Zhihengliuella halotolerans]